MNATHRLRLCGWLCLLPALPLVGRLFWLQLVRHEAYLARVDQSVERYDLEIIPRGRILDRDGRPLAESLPAWSAFLDLKVFAGMDQGQRALERIAQTLSLDLKELKRLTHGTRRTAWLKRKITSEEAHRLRALDLPCVGLEPDQLRGYPNGTLARPMLGEVNSEGRGAAGLELAFDKFISGRAMPVRLRRDGAGRSIRHDLQSANPAPPDLTLTVDRAIQFFAEEALDEAITARRAAGGTVIVQDPENGEILAMAVRPSDSRRNHAVQDVYEPGSTFKLVTAAAVLENAILKPGETVDCENGRWQLSAAVAIKDHEKQGRLALADIIKHSSNIGTGKLGLRLGAKEFYRFARLFGFGYKTGVSLPGESPGLVPEGPADDIRLANAAFGQGVAVTVLQLSAAYAAVANGGTLHEPRLVRSIGAAPLRPPVVVRRVASAETISKLQDILIGVIEGGTGVSAAIPGYSSAGKTGTAQKIDPATHKYSSTDYVASFAGWVPARQPRWSILVVIDTPRVGYYAAEVAAPVFSKVARQLLALKAIPPERPLPVRGQRPAPAIISPQPPSGAPPPRVPPLPRPSFTRFGPRANLPVMAPSDMAQAGDVL